MMDRFLKAGALAAAILVSAAGGASAQTVQGILLEGPTGPFVGYRSVPQAVLVFPPAAALANMAYFVDSTYCRQAYGQEHCLFVPPGVAVPPVVAPGVAVILGR